jgi:hypothetical protein
VRRGSTDPPFKNYELFVTLDEGTLGLFNKNCPPDMCKISNPYDPSSSLKLILNKDSGEKVDNAVAIYDSDDYMM